LKSRSDKNLAGFAVVALLIGGLSGLAILGWNRQERDYALTDAVGRRDIPAIRKLLEAGASPNARWSGYRWQDRLGCVYQRTDLCIALESYTAWDRVQGDAELVTLMQKYRTRK
jgi:hypothetical protein